MANQALRKKIAYWLRRREITGIDRYPMGPTKKLPCIILDVIAHLMEVLVCPNPMCIQRKL